MAPVRVWVQNLVQGQFSEGVLIVGAGARFCPYQEPSPSQPSPSYRRSVLNLPVDADSTDNCFDCWCPRETGFDLSFTLTNRRDEEFPFHIFTHTDTDKPGLGGYLDRHAGWLECYGL